MNKNQSYKEIEKLITDGKQKFPPDTIEALETAKTILGAYDQVRKERDIAIEQLRELGYELGEKILQICEMLEKRR